MYGKPLPDQQYIQVDATSIKCGVDLLGSSFFLLTRYEELLTPARDQHGRFPAGSSVAARAGFLQRPLVDEYVELLWLMLKQLWPQLPRRENRYQFLLSHDVDAPFAVAGRSPAEVTLSIGYFLLRRLSYSRARQRLSSAWNVYRQGARVDPYNTFPYIMSLSERHGLHSTFNFITHRRAGRFDGNYSLRSPIIRNLMKAIFQRGHKIGLHPGYTTFRDCTKVAQEFDELRVQCKGLGIRQTSWGGRQHFLRWENPTTWRAWDSAGIHYDSSLGFHDAVGFRCGTCREYPTYDLIRRQALR